MTIKTAPYLGVAVPINDSEISRLYWQTTASVADIGKSIGITWARNVKVQAGPARLSGVCCSGCKEEMVVNGRTEAAGPILDKQSGAPYAIERIRCKPCHEARRASKAKRNFTEMVIAKAPSPDGNQSGSQPGKQEKTEFYQSWEWRTLRVKVLQQYGTRCMCCGATPAHVTVGGEPVMIVVDHIKPLSKRWDLRLDRNNLQVLCQECNQGKGAWDETDFRASYVERDGESLQ